MKTTSNDYRNDFPNDEFQLNNSLNIFEDCHGLKEDFEEWLNNTQEHSAQETYEKWLEESPVNLEDCF